MRLVFLLFVFCFSFICINHAQNGHEENRLDLPQSISEKDSTWNVFGIVVGCFPKLDDNSFVSPGFSTLIFFEKESLISRFASGWYASYMSAFKQAEFTGMQFNDNYSFGRMFVIYDAIKESKSNLKLKLGLGLTYWVPDIFSIVALTGHFSIHYTHLINQNIKAGISVSLETILPSLQPPVIGLEINF